MAFMNKNLHFLIIVSTLKPVYIELSNFRFTPPL